MSRKRTFVLFIPIVIAMVALDRLAKVWAVDHLRQGAAGPDFGLVDLTLVHNGQGSGAIFIAIAIVICAAVIIWLVVGKRHNALEITALALVVAGGIGNCIDRLITGYVVDFIRFTFIDFPVFNVADICVTCGVILFLVAIIFTGVLSDADEEEG